MQDETAQPLIEGRYALTGRVATSDLGPVEMHTALDKQLERTVAVQLLPASAPAEERARFLDTQRIAAGIHHCGVVQVYDVGEWEGAAFSIVEKDAASRGGPTPAPDAESALSTARQVAEALQCVRDAGLDTWAFTPAALRTGADGAPRIALLDGLHHDTYYGSALSARREDDARALGALLGRLIAGLPLAAVPAGVHELIERASSLDGGESLTAGAFAEEVARLELAAQQPTEQYAETHDPAPTPYLAYGEIDPHDAPTLAAPVLPAAAPAVVATPTTPYEGTPPPLRTHIVPREDEPPRRAVPLLPVTAGGLLLLALLLFVAWPRAGAPTQLAGSAASAAESTPTTAPPPPAPTPAVVLAPAFLGKTLPEAKAEASAAGLGLVVTSAAHDAQYPADTVASQDPGPGTPLSPGAEVNLVLSLGPEPPPEVEPPPPPPPSGDDDDDDKDEKDNGRGKKKKP